MSMSVAISLDTSRIRFNLDNLAEGIRNIENGLLRAVDSVVIPDLYTNSQSVWNVRTGLYSSSWFSQIIGPNMVRVGNDARNPRNGYAYSQSLEWGWGSVESPGVLYPTVYGDLELIAGELLAWIQEQTVM